MLSSRILFFLLWSCQLQQTSFGMLPRFYNYIKNGIAGVSKAGNGADEFLGVANKFHTDGVTGNAAGHGKTGYFHSSLSKDPLGFGKLKSTGKTSKFKVVDTSTTSALNSEAGLSKTMKRIFQLLRTSLLRSAVRDVELVPKTPFEATQYVREPSTAFSESRAFQTRYGGVKKWVNEDAGGLSDEHLKDAVKLVLDGKTNPNEVLIGSNKEVLSRKPAPQRIQALENQIETTIRQLRKFASPNTERPLELSDLAYSLRIQMKGAPSPLLKDVHNLYQQMADYRVGSLAAEKTAVKATLPPELQYMAEFLDLFGPKQMALPGQAAAEQYNLLALGKDWQVTREEMSALIDLSPAIKRQLVNLRGVATQNKIGKLSQISKTSDGKVILERLSAYDQKLKKAWSGSPNPQNTVERGIENIRNSGTMKALEKDLKNPADDSARMLQFIEPVSEGRYGGELAFGQLPLQKFGFAKDPLIAKKLVQTSKEAELLLRAEYADNLAVRLFENQLEATYTPEMISTLRSFFSRPNSLQDQLIKFTLQKQRQQLLNLGQTLTPVANNIK